MRRFVLAALAAAVLLVPGCGGGGNGDKEKIEATIKDYFTAFADGDPAKACDELVSEAQDAIAKAAHQKDCQSAIAVSLSRANLKRYQSRLRSVQVVSVDITGAKATAKVRAIGSTTSVPLRKEGDGWKIEGKVGGAG